MFKLKIVRPKDLNDDFYHLTKDPQPTTFDPRSQDKNVYNKPVTGKHVGQRVVCGCPCECMSLYTCARVCVCESVAVSVCLQDLEERDRFTDDHCHLPRTHKPTDTRPGVCSIIIVVHPGHIVRLRSILPRPSSV